MNIPNKWVRLILIFSFLHNSKSDEPPSLQDYKSYTDTDENPMVEPFGEDASITEKIGAEIWKRFKKDSKQSVSSIFDPFTSDSQSWNPKSPKRNLAKDKDNDYPVPQRRNAELEPLENPKEQYYNENPREEGKTSRKTPKEHLEKARKKYRKMAPSNGDTEESPLYAPKLSSPMTQRSINRNKNSRRKSGFDLSEEKNGKNEEAPLELPIQKPDIRLNRNQKPRIRSGIDPPEENNGKNEEAPLELPIQKPDIRLNRNQKLRIRSGIDPAVENNSKNGEAPLEPRNVKPDIPLKRNSELRSRSGFNLPEEKNGKNEEAPLEIPKLKPDLEVPVKRNQKLRRKSEYDLLDEKSGKNEETSLELPNLKTNIPLKRNQKLRKKSEYDLLDEKSGKNEEAPLELPNLKANIPLNRNQKPRRKSEFDIPDEKYGKNGKASNIPVHRNSNQKPRPRSGFNIADEKSGKNAETPLSHPNIPPNRNQKSRNSAVDLPEEKSGKSESPESPLDLPKLPPILRFLNKKEKQNPNRKKDPIREQPYYDETPLEPNPSRKAGNQKFDNPEVDLEISPPGNLVPKANYDEIPLELPNTKRKSRSQIPEMVKKIGRNQKQKDAPLDIPNPRRKTSFDNPEINLGRNPKQKAPKVDYEDAPLEAPNPKRKSSLDTSEMDLSSPKVAPRINYAEAPVKRVPRRKGGSESSGKLALKEASLNVPNSKRKAGYNTNNAEKGLGRNLKKSSKVNYEDDPLDEALLELLNPRRKSGNKNPVSTEVPLESSNTKRKLDFDKIIPEQDESSPKNLAPYEDSPMDLNPRRKEGFENPEMDISSPKNLDPNVNYDEAPLERIGGSKNSGMEPEQENLAPKVNFEDTPLETSNHIRKSDLESPEMDIESPRNLNSRKANSEDYPLVPVPKPRRSRKEGSRNQGNSEDYPLISKPRRKGGSKNLGMKLEPRKQVPKVNYEDTPSELSKPKRKSGLDSPEIDISRSSHNARLALRINYDDAPLEPTPRRKGSSENPGKLAPKLNYEDALLDLPSPKRKSGLENPEISAQKDDNEEAPLDPTPRRKLGFENEMDLNGNFDPKENDDFPASKYRANDLLPEQDQFYEDRIAPKTRFFDRDLSQDGDIAPKKFQDSGSEQMPKFRFFDKDLYEDNVHSANYAEDEMQKSMAVDFRMDLQTESPDRLANSQVEVAPLDQPPEADEDYQKSTINKRDLLSAQDYESQSPHLRHAFNIPITGDFEVHNDVKKLADSVERLEEDVKMMLEHIGSNQIPAARIDPLIGTENDFVEKRETKNPGFEEFLLPQNPAVTKIDDEIEAPELRIDKNPEKRIYDSLLRETNAPIETPPKAKHLPKSPKTSKGEKAPKEKAVPVAPENPKGNSQKAPKGDVRMDPEGPKATPKASKVETKAEPEIPKASKTDAEVPKAAQKEKSSKIETRIDPEGSKGTPKAIKIESRMESEGSKATPKVPKMVTKGLKGPHKSLNLQSPEARLETQAPIVESTKSGVVAEKRIKGSTSGTGQTSKPQAQMENTRPVTRNKKSAENQQKSLENLPNKEKSAETSTKPQLEPRNIKRIMPKVDANVLAEKRSGDPKKVPVPVPVPVPKRQKLRSEDTSSDDSSTSIENLKKRYKKTMKSNIFNAYEVQKDFLSYYPSFQRYRIEKRLQRNRFAKQHQKRPNGYIPPREFYDITPNRHYPKNGFFPAPEALKPRIQVGGPTAAEGFVKYSQQNYPRPIFPPRINPRVPVKSIMSSSSEDSTSEVVSSKRIRGVARNLPLKGVNETDKAKSNLGLPPVPKSNIGTKATTTEILPQKTEATKVPDEKNAENSKTTKMEITTTSNVESTKSSAESSTTQGNETSSTTKTAEKEKDAEKSPQGNSAESSAEKSKSNTAEISISTSTSSPSTETTSAGSKRKLKVPKESRTKSETGKTYGESDIGSETNSRTEKLAKTRLEQHSDQNSTITIVQEASFIPAKEDQNSKSNKRPQSSQNSEVPSDMPKKHSAKNRIDKISKSKKGPGIEKALETSSKKIDPKDIPKKNSNGKIRIDKNSKEVHKKPIEPSTFGKRTSKKHKTRSEPSGNQNVNGTENVPENPEGSTKKVSVPKEILEAGSSKKTSKDTPEVAKKVPKENSKSRMEETVEIPKKQILPKEPLEVISKKIPKGYSEVSKSRAEDGDPSKKTQSDVSKILEKPSKNISSGHSEKSSKTRNEPNNEIPEAPQAKPRSEETQNAKVPDQEVSPSGTNDGKEKEPKEKVPKEKMNFPLKKDAIPHGSNEELPKKGSIRDKIGFPLKNPHGYHLEKDKDNNKDVSLNESYKQKVYRKRRPRPSNVPRKYNFGHANRGTSTKYKLRGSYEEKAPDQSNASGRDEKDGLKTRIYLEGSKESGKSKEVPELRAGKLPEGKLAAKRDYTAPDMMKQIQNEILNRLSKDLKIGNNGKTSGNGLWDGKFLGPINIFLSPGPQFMLPLSFGKGVKLPTLKEEKSADSSEEDD